jgi:hypothetical protein
MHLICHSTGQLSQQVIGQERALRGGQGVVRTQRVERIQRPLANARAINRQHRRDVVVAAPLLQHELDHRALVGRKAV